MAASRSRRSFAAYEKMVTDATPFPRINFRDLHLVNPRIKPGRLFRSGTPSALTPEEVSTLVNNLAIRTIIDLREAHESEADPGPQLVHHVFARAPAVHEVALDKLELQSLGMFNEQLDELSVTPLASPSEHLEKSSSTTASQAVDQHTNPSADAQSSESTTAAAAPFEASSKDHDAQVAATIELCNSFGRTNRIKYFIPLAERSVMTKALLHSITWQEKLHVASRYFLGVTWDANYKEEAKDYMLKHFDSKGLLGLNKIMLTYSTHMLSRALKIIAAEHHSPVLFHCFHGKDRTGLVTALVLALLKTPVNDIANDYHLSQGFGESEAGRAHFAKTPQLTVDKWCKAPKQVIVDTLRWIATEHGSVEQYCIHSLEFSREWQEKLIATLTE